MSQQTLQMGNSPDPAAAAAHAAAEAAALKAGEGVQISSTVIGADGQKRTDFQQTPGQPAQPPPQDNLILGKFKTADDLAKAYKELEAKLGQQPPAQKPADPNTPQGAAQQSAIDKADAEYRETGTLSEETLTALEATGLNRQTVQNYVAGVKALEQQAAQEAYGYVGGQEAYQAMTTWAAKNLSPSEIDAYDAALDDPKTAEMAIKGLFARFQQTGTFEPGRSVTGNAGAQQGDMFRSRHEMMAAMKDERYTKGDTAFHAEVQAKMARAMAAGINLFA